jgi:PAS domain S-box-containing protein
MNVQVDVLSAPVAQPSGSSDLEVLFRLTDRLYRSREPTEVHAAALDAITEGLGCQRASILLFDQDGVMDFVAWRGLSDGYRHAVRGHTPWQPQDRDPPPIFVSDIDETDESDSIKAIIRAEDIRALGFIPLVAHGTVVGKFMTYYAEPRRFPEREINLAVTIARQVGFSIERGHSEAARAEAERHLRESEERFRLMSEDAPVMIWMSDASGRCLHLNRMLRNFWGVEADGIKNFNWSDTMHPDDAARIGSEIFEAMTQRKSATIRGRYRSTNGSYRVLHTTARPRFSGNGDFLGMIGVNLDLTEQERAEATQRVLIDELNHRVKNTLATVQSLAMQTFRDVPESKDARDRFTGRLIALARAHDVLTSRQWESADLMEIADRALEPFRNGHDRIAKHGPAIHLTPKQTLSISLALHELATNAVKYGALSNEAGSVSLQWEVLDDAASRCLRLLWREENGPPVRPPVRQGFGSRLIGKNLAGELNGEARIDYLPGGVVASIVCPVQPAAKTEPAP